jgi:hypothetical protein
MRIRLLLILPLVLSTLSLSAQKATKGTVISIKGENVEIKIPVKKSQVVKNEGDEEVKQVEKNLQRDLKDYTIEMQDQRFISNNVITEVNAEIIREGEIAALKVIFSYTLVNDTLLFHTDDYAPGKYLASESNALCVTLAIIKRSIEGELAKYLKMNNEILISINGSADATPIRGVIPYKCEYGDNVIENCKFNGEIQKMIVSKNDGISSNHSLAFLRSYGVMDYFKSNIFVQKYSNLNYLLSASVSGKQGGQFRRVSIEMIIYDAFE